MKQVAREFGGTDTLIYLEPRRACAPGLPRALGFSPLRHHAPEPEGAPPLVSKGGLLRPNATNSLLFVLTEAQA
jgi:hypothetical protein